MSKQIAPRSESGCGFHSNLSGGNQRDQVLGSLDFFFELRQKEACDAVQPKKLDIEVHLKTRAGAAHFESDRLPWSVCSLSTARSAVQ